MIAIAPRIRKALHYPDVMTSTPAAKRCWAIAHSFSATPATAIYVIWIAPLIYLGLLFAANAWLLRGGSTRCVGGEYVTNPATWWPVGRSVGAVAVCPNSVVGLGRKGHRD